MNVAAFKTEDVEAWPSFFCPHESGNLRNAVAQLRRPMMDRNAVLALDWQPRLIIAMEVITGTPHVIQKKSRSLIKKVHSIFIFQFSFF